MSIIVVQRGHVPRTTGKTGAPGEQAFAIAASERIEHYVTAMGHGVRLIDADPPLTSYRGDMFVAVHYNGSTNPSAHGASVGYQTAEGAEFAEAWARHYAAQGWSGGFEDDNNTDALRLYYGVKEAVRQGNTRAFIIEAGFWSNPGDAVLLASPDGPDRVGRSVAAAVAEILGLPGDISLQEDWFDMASRDDLKEVVREVLAERLDTGQFPPRFLAFEVGTAGVVWACNSVEMTRSNLTGDDVEFLLGQYEALGYARPGEGLYYDAGPETLQLLDEIPPLPVPPLPAPTE